MTNEPASAAASSELGSEISSFVDSGDDLSEKLVVLVHDSIGVTTNMVGTALPSTVMALPLSPSTIQSIVVPLSVQATPSVAGSSGMPSVTQSSELLINMPHAAMQLAVMQPAAMPLSATHSIMSVRPNQMGYFTGAPSAFNTQSTQFPNMSNPIWKVSQREQRLQNQLLQERQQFKAWKALHAQPHVSQMQAPPIVSSGPTVSEKVKIDDVEVISLRSASTKRARSRDQATATT